MTELTLQTDAGLYLADVSFNEDFTTMTAVPTRPPIGEPFEAQTIPDLRAAFAAMIADYEVRMRADMQMRLAAQQREEARLHFEAMQRLQTQQAQQAILQQHPSLATPAPTLRPAAGAEPPPVLGSLLGAAPAARPAAAPPPPAMPRFPPGTLILTLSLPVYRSLQKEADKAGMSLNDYAIRRLAEVKW